MSTLPFESTVFVGKETYTHYFSPDEATAQQIAHWHLAKGATQVVVLDRATRERRTYEKQGDTILSPETGEEIFEHPGIQELSLQIAGLEKANRSLRSDITKLKNEKEGKARESSEWNDSLYAFEFWKRICGHPNSKFDLARYQNVAPFLKGEGNSLELCMRAISGAAFAAGKQEMKNGATAKYDGWSLIFRNREKFESFCNRAPKDWKERYGVDL